MMMEVWEEVERSVLPGEGTVPLQTQRDGTCMLVVLSTSSPVKWG